MSHKTCFLNAKILGTNLSKYSAPGVIRIPVMKDHICHINLLPENLPSLPRRENIAIVMFQLHSKLQSSTDFFEDSNLFPFEALKVESTALCSSTHSFWYQVSSTFHYFSLILTIISFNWLINRFRQRGNLFRINKPNDDSTAN